MHVCVPVQHIACVPSFPDYHMHITVQNCGLKLHSFIHLSILFQGAEILSQASTVGSDDDDDHDDTVLEDDEDSEVELDKESNASKDNEEDEEGMGESYSEVY